MRTHFHHTDLQLHKALCVRHRCNRSVHVHGGNMHHVSNLDRFRNLAGHFFLLCKRVLRLFHTLLNALDFVLLCASRLFHGAQLRYDLLRFPARIFDNALCFFFGFLDGFFPLFFQLLTFCLCLIANSNHLFAGFLCNLPLFLSNLPVIFSICNDVLKTNLLLRQQILGFIDDEFRQAKLSGNFKRIGFAGNAN